MHTNIQRVVLLLALVLVLVNVEPVAAQGSVLLPCSGESVSGTVVAVDEETGTATLDTGAGLCTVVLGGEYEHPIVALLGSYFGDVSVEDLASALETTQGCAVHDPDSDTWAWADCDADGAVPATVIAENEDGTFTVTVDGVEVTVTVDDPTIAEGLREALQALTAENWRLDGEGGVIRPGDEIAAYHEEGMGFGVLAKLYAMAAELEKACAAAESDEPCAATVAELVEAFQSGMGMGQLFKEYGKPAIHGVGHVKQQMKKHENGSCPPSHAGPKDDCAVDSPPHVDSKDNHTGGPPPHAGPKKPKKSR
jgi:hypothetical protein